RRPARRVLSGVTGVALRDQLKLRSCATLFAQVTPPGSVFEQLHEQYFDGASDPRTLELLQTK
ncbi:MAG: DUF1810 domain-containing protein, partial [Gammaproteobacteria bacterium]|nr:DUF1810 domain-containing protein [Gammaproteobacteria bacterium]